MSKVIKDTGDFVAKKIVPVEDRPAVWNELAKQVEDPKIQKEEKSRVSPESSDFENIAEPHLKDQVKSSQFDTDFSAPEPNNETIESSMPEEAVSPPEPQRLIDIEAIQEEYFNKGLQAGIERTESDYGSSIKALQSIFEQLNTIRETILSNSMDEMQNLVLHIAAKIIRQSVSEQESTIIKTIEKAIQQAVKSDEFMISVNPDDYNTISSRSGDFINSLSGLENIIVKADPTVEQGGCLIESSNCTVDATLGSQLELITEKLKSK